MSDAPLGPTVLLDAFEEGVPLDVLLRQKEVPDFYQRIDIIEQIGKALAHCHRKNVFHSNISPESVLVRRSLGNVEARLFNFQLGHGEDVESTRHWSALASELGSVYMAPEIRDGSSPRSAVTDMFSLGAFAHFALTGQPPGETVAEVDERLKRENHLDPRAVDDSIPEKVAEAVRQATMLQSQLRIDDVEDWIALLLDQVTQPEMEEEEPEVSPLDARSDDVLPGGLKVRKVLGHGATSRVLEVERDGKAFALKVSLTTSSSIAATRCSSSPRQSSSSPQVLQKTTTSPFSPT